MKTIQILLLVALLTACATERRQESWVKPDGSGSQAELTADDGACRAQAFSVPGAMNNMLQVAAVYSSCMQGKGWARQP